MRLNRSSLRGLTTRAGWPLCAVLVLGVGVGCGAGTAAQPTQTAVPATSAPPVLAPSPQRPAFASPSASPSALPAAVSATPTAATDAGSTEYEVASGDTLLTIAEKQYGDGTQWRRIYDANKDTIGTDPDKLKIGMKLKIPPKQS